MENLEAEKILMEIKNAVVEELRKKNMQPIKENRNLRRKSMALRRQELNPEREFATTNALSRNAFEENPIRKDLNFLINIEKPYHAAIFFAILRSNGMNCAETSIYYECIVRTYPTLSWKFYMKLIYQCGWKEHFIECSQELQPDILYAVLKNIVEIKWNEDGNLMIYSLYTVVQAIQNFFTIDGSTSSFLVDKFSALQNCCPFAFQFASNVITEISSLHQTLFEKWTRFIKGFVVCLLLFPEHIKTQNLIYLEREVPELDALEIYPFLADAVASAQSEDVKARLLNLFFKILESSEKIYNSSLEYILKHYGINDHFRLENFEDQLNCFTRKMMSDGEAEKCLLPLFIQSPRNVLKMLIEQALLQGSNEFTLMKVLKRIPIACLHSNFLIEELKPYFIKNEVVARENKNMTSVIESLMKIHTETSIVDFTMFLKKIIMPNLKIKLRKSAAKKLSLTLECLNVSLNVLVSKNVLEIKKERLSLLIQRLCSIIHKCIKFGDGKIKELAITTLSLLSKCQGITNLLKTKLWDNLSSYPPSVLVYISKLFGKASYSDLKGSESNLNDSLWIWCCNFYDDDLFYEAVWEKKFSYNNLLSVLKSVLPHLTKEEWFESSNYIRKYVSITNEEPCPLVVAEGYVTRCLMDSYNFTLKRGVCNINYLSNCFSNTIQRILDEEMHSYLTMEKFHLNWLFNKFELHSHLDVFKNISLIVLDHSDEVYRNLLPLLLTVKKSVEDVRKRKGLKPYCLTTMLNDYFLQAVE